MQMQSVQSISEQKEIGAVVGGDVLTARCHPDDEVMAKNILLSLHKAVPGRAWDLEIQSDSIRFWCDLHITFGCTMGSHELGKGHRAIKIRAEELVARIKAGAC